MGLAAFLLRLLGRSGPAAQAPEPPPGSPQPTIHPAQSPPLREPPRITPAAPSPESRAANDPAGPRPAGGLQPVSVRPPVSGAASRPPLQPVAAVPATTTARAHTAAPVQRVETPAPPGAAALKPGHRRLALQDPRIATAGSEPGGRRAHRARLPRDEARRLFAGTLRTGSRALRALATDAAQLERLGLPVWQDEAALAAALQLEVGALRHLSIHSALERTPHYVTFAVPKRTGGERLIMAPKTRLKAVQRRLNALLVDKLPASESAHGFRPGRSVRSNAAPHVRQRVVLRLDLKDFFPSIHFGRVRGMLLAFGYGYPVASTLAALMTEAPRQPVVIDGVTLYPPVGPRACPQGAPTSPGLSNAVVVRMDRRLAGLARRFGFAYTRYADDLTFSGPQIDAAHALRLLAGRIVRSEGFELNAAKTRVMRSGARQAVTGVVVNEVLGLSRQERRLFRAALHRQRTQEGERDARLEGKIAYVRMLNPAQADQLMAAPGHAGPLAR
jgi:hypothetical protein